MNIGSLIRGLLGEQKPGDAKTLELKPGQVVRGVVMNVSEDGQEALVQIQGVQVKAKLETPLRAGETALLQVQPPGEGGPAVLKPLSPTPGQPLSPSSMAEVLDFAGLPDTKENREMIKGMQTAGVPLTKENIAMFREALAVKPPMVPAAEWAESAAIAFHRGLPITPESVKGLHQAVFGPQLHQLLQSLEQQLASVISVGAVPAGDGGKGAVPASSPLAGAASGAAAETVPQQASPPAGGAGSAAQAATGQQQALLTKLQGLLQQLRGELAQPWAGGGTATPAAGQAAVPAGPAAAPGEGAAGPSPKPPTPGAEPWVGRLLKLLGAEHEQQSLRGAVSGPAGEAARTGSAALPGGQQATALPAGGAAGASAVVPAPAPAPAPAPSTAGAALSPPAAAQQQAAAGGVAASQPPAANAAGTGSGAVASAPVTTGNAASINHQAPVAQAGTTNQPGVAQPSVPSAQQSMAQGMQQQSVIASTQAGDSSQALQDTLKGVLLQVLSSQETPSALKEAAQQIVQHLTGQQLLLNTDRTAPFAQVTMFIPLHGADGEQTASVHIQSRRGRKGELDATNCRLLFDLDMRFLGPTLIDVQVVDRIVSLSFRNDQSFAAELFEGKKQELATAVASIGYQLLSVKTEPLPVDPQPSSDMSVQGTAAEYAPQTYKGVDMRI
ncbi:hypothetical protein M2277_000184 [Paenibacillus sp. LBL]|uniref:hypothetical protein n=1 Tax=Paenibacillus sp. LBL TaxID=2940563 RepID=UPI002474400C|nr:hypothetical protein [Paenibacillus sp. LBL]MDH6669540.1 hypothetical protein [Paenibacillus sp. LBL]